jgi:predicted aminopeptidase
MMSWSDRAVASLMFHELTHQVLYIDGDADFNEAFATAVEQVGTVYWLQQHNSAEIEDYMRLVEQQQQFRQLLLDTRRELQDLYKNMSLNDDDKRQQKKTIIENLRQRYHRDKLQWYKPNHYDAWFSRPINNARLTATMTYLERVPAFFAMFQDANRDWNTFYANVKLLSKIEKKPRETKIQELLNRRITLRDIFYRREQI